MDKYHKTDKNYEAVKKLDSVIEDVAYVLSNEEDYQSSNVRYGRCRNCRNTHCSAKSSSLESAVVDKE